MAGKVTVMFVPGGHRSQYPIDVMIGKATDISVDQTATGSSVTCKNAGASDIVAASGDVAMCINHGTADTDDVRIAFGSPATVDAAAADAIMLPAGGVAYWYGVQAGDTAAIKTK